jgi:hypothetical protein
MEQGPEYREGMTPASLVQRIREQLALVAPPAAFELPFAYGNGRLKVLGG